MQFRLTLLATSLMVAPAANAGFFDFVKGLVKGNTTFFIPSGNTDMAKYHVIALNTGSGAESSNLADAVEKRLSAIKLQEKTYYVQIYRDVGVKSGAFDFATISIDAGPSSLSETPSTESRVQCPRGKIVCSNDVATHYTVRCVTREAVTPISLSIRDGATAALIFSDRRDVTTESKVCSDTRGSLTSGGALIASNYESVANDLANRIAPKFERRALDLVSSDDSITGVDAETLKAAYEAASHNDMTSACKTYGEMNAKTPNKGALLFNMGYCSQAVGEFAKAKDLYEKARLAEAAPKEDIERYLEETNAWLSKGITSLMATIPADILENAKIKAAFNVIPANTQNDVSGAPSEGDVAQRLRQLKTLYDDGIITKSEYEDKRKRLLDAM